MFLKPHSGDVEGHVILRSFNGSEVSDSCGLSEGAWVDGSRFVIVVSMRTEVF